MSQVGDSRGSDQEMTAAGQSQKAERRGEPIDRFGAVASTLCALHCALCAALPALLGMLGLGVLLDQRAEWIFTVVALLFATAALVV